jgi:hypothetical protein
MDPRLSWEIVEATVAERQRPAESKRLAAAGTGQGSPHRGGGLDAAAVTVRFATPQDAEALRRLAVLDSRSVPTGTALVAEADGELLAALPLGEGSALADPFRPTAELLHLLELRAAQLRRNGRGRRRLTRLRRLGNRRTAPVEQ